ncbi:MAG: fimbrillin family protein [Bacteroidaceae bacterium]|nr:fimbrillin family protein [Bacteroidaceae bacterium]
MNRYIQSATILLAALAFAGCSKVEEFNCNPDSALQIESVGGVSQYALMQAQPASKAVIDGNELPGSEAAQGIGIFVTAQDGSAYDGHDKGYSNVEYTYNGEKWSTTTPIYLSNTVGKLYGYFPYNAGATNLKAVPIASSLNGTDYLYAVPQEVSITEKSVSLQMNHALARLHLTLKKGEKYNAAGVISGITLKSTAIDATGTMDITTGEVSATKTKTDKGVVELVASGSLSTGDQTYDILLVPADGSDAANPFDIFISIDGTTAGVTLSGENGITVQSGKQYDVTLEIDATGVKVTGVGVGVWGDGGSQTVQVNGHTVTVKLDEGVHEIYKDVWVMAYAQDENVVIEAFSKSEKKIYCQLNDDSMVTPETDGNVSKFVISAISKEVVATIGVFGEGGRKEITVNGHKIKVKYDEGSSEIDEDVWMMAYADGNTANILSYSLSGKPLIIREEDGKLLAPVEESNKSTFTFSDVTEDITATLSYAKTFKVTQSFKADVTPESGYFENYPAQGLGEVLEGRTTEVAVTVATNIPGYHFENIVCDERIETGNTIVLKNVSKNLEVVANYKFSDYPLPGVFTVADDGAGNVRKVQFARGNLWYQNGVFHNENEQYAFSSSDWEKDGHISHFMWCKSASESVKKEYSETGIGTNDNLFTNAGPTEPNENFAVNGQKGFWRTLSGGGNGEWEYLIKRKNGTLCKSGVKVCSSENCLILLPDDWKWGVNGVSDNWQDGGYPETSTEGKVTWKTMEAAGAVCLPAAGFRNGKFGYTYVYYVGDGYYWSSTPDNYNNAYSLYFHSGNVNPANSDLRSRAYAVRLVTNVK